MCKMDYKQYELCDIYFGNGVIVAFLSVVVDLATLTSDFRAMHFCTKRM